MSYVSWTDPSGNQHVRMSNGDHYVGRGGHFTKVT